MKFKITVEEKAKGNKMTKIGVLEITEDIQEKMKRTVWVMFL